ncbi:MAG: gliding motility-associated C-terminal domain-containing protein [Bacteroidota bacterium]
MKKWLLPAFFLLFGSNAFATHLRAGEIIATRVSCTALTFRITVTVYIDTGSGVHFGGPGEFLNFGDSTFVEVPDTPTTPRPDLGQNMGMAQFVITHTYAGYGRYLIRYAEPFRNGSVVNLDDPLSTLFYIETLVDMDPLLGCDNTPQLLVPPIDKACVGAAWYHNPGAYDTDGDSLSYQMVEPKMGKGVNVIDYRDPNTKEFYTRGGINYSTANENKNGPPTFSINATTGTIIWDAPGMQGEYNIAFLIKEWRKFDGKWVLLGYVERDMQIVVEDCNNRRPELQLPADICVEAGTLIDEDILGYDPDSDSVIIDVYSETLVVTPRAVISPSPSKYQASSPSSPAKIHYQWQTDCKHVRDQPYIVTVKITDKPVAHGTPLVQFKTWKITVVGPPPEWNSVQQDLSARSATLVWDKYTCSNVATTMQVWRRVDGVPYTSPDCVTGMPESLGYTKIAEVPIGQASYLDTNGGKGLAIGAKYCYRLVAVFPGFTPAESYVSRDTCLAPILADAPVITNVTVDKTSVDQGQITVKWRSPFDINKTQFPPPYSYEVYRAEGLTGKIKLTKPHPGRLTDSTYADVGINTESNAYNYRILAYDANNNRIDSSNVASSVRLEVHPQVNKIGLIWTADVPWSNGSDSYPMHLIYRGPEGATDDQLALIDSVNVNRSGFVYLDSGQYNNTPLDNTKTYCYRVMTRGTYGNPKILAPLLNFSQKICAIPNDTTPPCKPIFGSDIIAQHCDNLPNGGCGITVYSNTIQWNKPVDKVCGSDVVSYNIYVADQLGNEFRLYASDVRDTVFVDSNKDLTSFARCYKIQAVDRSGNFSELSEQFCFDNCTHYELPNVFSPNSDGCNDVFSAFGDPDRDAMCDADEDPAKCAKYVERVDFIVYDRWGKQVYELKDSKERSIYIRWNGLDNEGREMPAGVYYYRADVHYITVDPDNRVELMKGWVQLVRGQ